MSKAAEAAKVAAAVEAFKAAGGVVRKVEAGVSGRNAYRAAQDAVFAMKSEERVRAALERGESVEDALDEALTRRW